MMISNRHSKLKVLPAALAFGGALVLAEARPAQANAEGYALAGAAFLIVAAAATYATVMTMVCIPVGGIKASDHPDGFGGAFKNCFWLRKQPAQAESVARMPPQVETVREPTEAKETRASEIINDENAVFETDETLN